MSFFFFFNDTATTEIYTLSLHDALPICAWPAISRSYGPMVVPFRSKLIRVRAKRHRSEEHTSELQSLTNLVCRLLLEKKKKKTKKIITISKNATVKRYLCTITISYNK